MKKTNLYMRIRFPRKFVFRGPESGHLIKAAKGDFLLLH